MNEFNLSIWFYCFNGSFKVAVYIITVAHQKVVEQWFGLKKVAITALVLYQVPIEFYVFESVKIVFVQTGGDLVDLFGPIEVKCQFYTEAFVDLPG